MSDTATTATRSGMCAYCYGAIGVGTLVRSWPVRWYQDRSGRQMCHADEGACARTEERRSAS